MTSTPARTVTLLMTDIEGSTAKWERDPQAMQAALARHDAIADAVVSGNGGSVVKARGEGDSLFVVFQSPISALMAAQEIQERFAGESWPGNLEITTRIALHCGEVHVQEADYYGPTVNRCARLRSIGHGGQTLLSRTVQQYVQHQLPEGMRLRDLGTHRLRDLQEPERVFQLETGATKVFPPLRSLDARPNNLPLQLTSFVGRTDEIRSVQALIRTNRLISLVGPGGCGKTRLAIQVAADNQDPFPDGVWFVELAAFAGEEELARAIAREVRIGSDTRRPDPLEALESIPEALLVLDNAEHAVTEVARVVASILQRVMKIRILVTSREPLRVVGEAVHRVEPLSVPDQRDTTAEAVARAGSVQLFVERSLAKNERFALTDSNAVDVARICRRLDGIPLAVEQAASMVPYLSANEIADRLEETIDVLESDEQGVVPRHRTLEATIDWSYGLLLPQEQRLFRRLAVIPGSFTMRTVEAVCTDEQLPRNQVLKLLRGLVDKSLVVRSTTTQDVEVRHRMLAVVAEYARSHTGLEENFALERKLFDWAHSVVSEAGSSAFGTGEATWTKRFEEDNASIRKAIDIGFREGFPETIDIVFGLRHFWLRKGHIVLARGYLKRALVEGTDVPDGRRAQLLNTLGAFAWRMNDLVQAQEHYEESLAIQRRLGDHAATASVLNNIGILASDRGDHEHAIEMYDEALRLAQGLGDENVVRLTTLNRSMSYLDVCRYDDALEDMRRACEMSEKVDDFSRMALLHAAIGGIAVKRNHIAEAVDELTKAFTLWSEVTDLFTMAEALLDVATLAMLLERPDEAIRCVRYYLGVLRSTQTTVKQRQKFKLESLQACLAPHGPLTPLDTPNNLSTATLGLLAELRARMKTRQGLTPTATLDNLETL